MISPRRGLRRRPACAVQARLDDGHGAVVAAPLHATAHGVFTAWLNGAPVADDVLSPGWSSYEWRLRYRELRRHRSRAGRAGRERRPGSRAGQRLVPRPPRLGAGVAPTTATELGALAQLEIEFADGHRQVVGTDESWRAGPSDGLAERPLRRARRSTPGGGTQPGCGRASQVTAGPACTSTTGSTPRSSRRTSGRPSSGTRRSAPVRIWTSPSGRTLVDFGQNLVGWLRFTVRGERGSTITIRHAEVLEDGELGVRPLRTAKATDRFVLCGGRRHLRARRSPSTGSATPRWTAGPGSSLPDSLVAVVVHSDLRRTGDVRVLGRAAQPVAPQRRVGTARELRSTSRPTARSATSGWAGPATSRCSHRRRRSSTTSRPSSTTGSPTSQPSSGPPTASCRS